MPKYPDVVVKLVDEDKNPYSILSRVWNSMRRAKIPAEEINEFLREASGEDYDHLLLTVKKWVTTT